MRKVSPGTRRILKKVSPGRPSPGAGKLRDLKFLTNFEIFDKFEMFDKFEIFDERFEIFDKFWLKFLI